MRTTFTKNRLEAFSDGVLAIIITIMVLEMKPPLAAARFADLKPVIPIFISYIISYSYVGIYWNNHHHMFQATHKTTGGILWANLHLLFWLSLIPFVTGWMGANHFAAAPTALYGIVLLCSAVAYLILQSVIVRVHGDESVLARAVGKDFKGKISLVLYISAICLAFVDSWISEGLYVMTAILWIIPDRRIERALVESSADPLANRSRISEHKEPTCEGSPRSSL